MDKVIKKCPCCAVDMREIGLRTKYDIPFTIEQCDKCGGLWFDDLEMYMARMGEKIDIEGIDLEKLKNADNAIPEVLACPNDHAHLKRFKDPFFPESLVLEKCPECHGFWLNRGEFTQFQKHRKTLIDKHNPKKVQIEMSEKDKSFEDQLGKMMANASSGTYESLGSLGNFLSRPVKHPYAASLDDNNEGEKAAAVVSIIFTLLKLLIKLFVK